MKNIFSQGDALKNKLGKGYIMLFLDYDGTITPIVKEPDKAVLSREAKKLLKELSEEPDVKLAVISGRALRDIKNRVGIKNIIYSGNHGLEIAGPKIKFKPEVPIKYRLILQRIKAELERRLASARGVFVEDKGLSLSVHFRRAQNKKIPFIKTSFYGAVMSYLVENKIRIKPGKKVFEVRPPVEWDKGKVVLWLIARQKVILKGKPILPVYIGDDVTDEDAFRALRGRGLAISVGNKKYSRAEYYAKDVKAARAFLKLILNMQKQTDHGRDN